ncbi:MAG: DegT/DnrJ/EryC1/StrS family aminotransferase [Phycisphaerales bacterium]|nr:DegT/DnrJ/EryC1/StrS family aminotransferase [Phycisphaerales bacterium]
MATAAPTLRPRRDIPFGRPMIGEAEKAAVIAALGSPTLTHGPRVRQFETDFAAFTGAERAVATSSCMASLHMAYLALGIEPGSEVIVAAQTHIATAHAAELCGATCVFVDCDKDGAIDVAQVESAICSRTRAIAIVHYAGFPVDIAALKRVAERHGVPIVEDCALALGTRFNGAHVGLHGDIGCFSFYPVKHITTGEGGMVISRRADLLDRVSRLRAFGIDRNIVSERALPGEYDAIELGLNYRMSEIAAAIGIEQLRRAPEFLERRRENFTLLREGLAGGDDLWPLHESQPVADVGVYCLVAMLSARLTRVRPQLMRALSGHGVGASVYYPRPVPAMSYYRHKYAYDLSRFPRAGLISSASIALPIGPHLDAADIRYMIETIPDAIQEALSA